MVRDGKPLSDKEECRLSRDQLYKGRTSENEQVKLIRENCPLLAKLQSQKQNIIREKLRLKIVLA
jgi:hypothetical protein